IRVNRAMLETTFAAAGAGADFGFWRGTLATGSAGDILVNSGPPDDPFTPGMVGQGFSVYNGFCTGSYLPLTVTQFIHSTHVRVDYNVGSNLSGQWGKIGSVAGGWKQSMVVASPPYGDTNNELVLNDGYQCGYPQMYTNKGIGGIGTQFLKPYIADRWVE